MNTMYLIVKGNQSQNPLCSNWILKLERLSAAGGKKCKHLLWLVLNCCLFNDTALNFVFANVWVYLWPSISCSNPGSLCLTGSQSITRATRGWQMWPCTRFVPSPLWACNASFHSKFVRAKKCCMWKKHSPILELNISQICIKFSWQTQTCFNIVVLAHLWQECRKKPTRLTLKHRQ